MSREAAQGLGEEGVSTRPSATLLGFLAIVSSLRAETVPTPITRPPAIAQDIVVAQRKPLELTHERDTHEKKQNFNWLSVGWESGLGRCRARLAH